MNIKLSLLAISAILIGLLYFAQPPTINAGSEDSLKESISKVQASLSAGEIDQFNQAVQIVVFDNIGLADLFSGELFKDGLIPPSISKSLHGKTAKEVITAANKISASREAEQKLEELKELKQLIEKRDNFNTHAKALKKFIITRAAFHSKNPDQGRHNAVIELKVSNQTGHAISRVYFKAALTVPGRSVPINKDNFNYMVRGGIEHGEERFWSLEPNILSSWADIKPPRDAVFKVRPIEIEGPEGETIYSIKGFGKAARARLKELEEKYNTSAIN